MKKQVMLLALLLMGVLSVKAARWTGNEVNQLEQGIREHRIARDRLEKKRVRIATDILKRERDLNGRLAVLDQSKSELVDVDDEINDVNHLINELISRETAIMDKVKEGNLGIGKAVRRALERIRIKKDKRA